MAAAKQKRARGKQAARVHDLDPSPRWVRALEKAYPLLHPVFDTETNAIDYRPGIVREGDTFKWRLKGELPEWVEQLDEDEVRAVERAKKRGTPPPVGTSLNALGRTMAQDA